MSEHLAKRSFCLAGHRTSIALEPEFWNALEAIARARGQNLLTLIEAIDAARGAPGASLASALRVFALGEAMRWAGR